MVANEERYKYPSILDHEWNMMRDYMSAMELALNIAIDWHEEVGDGGNEDDF